MPIQPQAQAVPVYVTPYRGETSEYERIVEWRVEWLLKAGWSNAWANTIARIAKEDLIASGWSEDHAEREFFDFWRKAEKAIKCGSEAKALYLLSLLTEPL